MANEIQEKLGRNDACVCGSGKKHKKCCLYADVGQNNTINFSWLKLRKTEGAVVDNHLMPYLGTLISGAQLKSIFYEFLAIDLPDEANCEIIFKNFFMPWVLFNYIPFAEFDIDNFDSEKTIAQNYLLSYKRKLDRNEQRFLEAISLSYYSFYSVLEVEFEKSILIKDILLGTTHTLQEKQGTHHLKRGNVIFTRILTIDEQSIAVGMAPFAIPVSYHQDVIDFRQWLIEQKNLGEALNPNLLRTLFEPLLFQYFFDKLDEILNHSQPTLYNTDNELIEFATSYFKLSLPLDAALCRLLPMTLSKNPDEFLQDADYDESGTITRIEFPWLKKGNTKNKTWENTIMGNVTLENERLILETNSQKRMERGKKLLVKHLGKAVCFEQSVIESVERKLGSDSAQTNQNHAPNELLNSPEFQAEIEKMTKAHWDSWFDENIPALGNQTPRDAAKTALGREKLEALLLEYEQHSENQNSNLLKVDIHYLKAKLGLNNESL